MHMKKRIIALLLISLLAACTGIPMRSLPKLMKLQGELLTANPAEFMLAIQLDARMVPAPGAVPVLQLAIRPSKPGAFDAIDKKLPMRFTVASANTLGLPIPTADRRWLVYSLPAESQSELAQIQSYFKRIEAKKQENGGGSVSVGIAQEGVAAKDPAFAATRWESWLQVSRQEGFFELWSGSVAELLKRANKD
jgi:hypothetical protein